MANGLVSANQFQLVPEISRLGSGAAQGFQLGRQFKQGQREQAQFEQQQQAGQLAGQFLGGQKEAGQQLAAVDPQRAQAIQSFLTSQSEEERAEDLRENQVLTQTALSAQSLPPEQRRAFLQQERERFRADKRDTSNIDRALAGDDAALNQAIELQARQGLEIQQQAERLFPELATPATEIQRETLAQRKTEQQFREQQAKIEGEKLSTTVQKILDTAQTEAIDAGQRSRSLSVLADDIEKLDIGGGLASTTSETFKTILGSQDEVSELRRRFNAVRASQSVQNLPPGPASDKDIQLALSGFPAENAGGQQIISFLKGAAKLESINAAFQTFKSDLISENKNTKGLLQKWNQKATSSALGRDVTNSELFITAQEEGITIDDLKKQLGID